MTPARAQVVRYCVSWRRLSSRHRSIIEIGDDDTTCLLLTLSMNPNPALLLVRSHLECGNGNLNIFHHTVDVVFGYVVNLRLLRITGTGMCERV